MGCGPSHGDGGSRLVHNKQANIPRWTSRHDIRQAGNQLLCMVPIAKAGAVAVLCCAVLCCAVLASIEVARNTWASTVSLRGFLARDRGRLLAATLGPNVLFCMPNRTSNTPFISMMWQETDGAFWPMVGCIGATTTIVGLALYAYERCGCAGLPQPSLHK
jgi:hypothetical protein